MTRRRLLLLGTAGLLFMAACSPAVAPPVTSSTTTAPPTTTTTTVPPTTTSTLPPPEPPIDPEGSYAVLAFVTHLPEYGTTKEGVPDRPWVRLHTTHDYITLLRLVAAERTNVVLSYSPVLLEQIAQVASGVTDRAAAVATTPPGELTPEDRDYIDRVFFIAGPAQLERFPRLLELATKRAAGRRLSTAEYRDVQVLFHLAWTSPLLLDEEPLKTIAGKGRGYSTEEAATVVGAHQAAAAEFLDTLRELWTDGVVEVATTPLANPVLPLLTASRMDSDAADQITQGIATAANVLGEQPPGMAPEEGLVDQTTADAMEDAGIDWLLVADDERAQPYRLASEGGTMLALPADPVLGRRIVDTYFDVAPATAAADTVQALATGLADQPGAVRVVVVDGTEPWGRYADGGVAFLRALLQRMDAAAAFDLALPGELDAALSFEPGPYPPPRDELLDGSRAEAAWRFLVETRSELERQRAAGVAATAALTAAADHLMQAQGVDWFRWYGDARSSDDDAYHDARYRARLAAVWEVLGEEPPGWAGVPLYEAPPVAATAPARPVAAEIVIDNDIVRSEWANAGRFEEPATGLIAAVRYAFDEANLYIRVDFADEVLGDRAPGFDLYLAPPGGPGSPVTPRGGPIGFSASHVARWRATNPVQVTIPEPHPDGPAAGAQPAGFDGNSVEFAFDRAVVAPDMRPGDRIEFRIVDVTGGPEGAYFPRLGRGAFELPNLEEGVVLARLADRNGDDHGPGSYSYTVDSETPQGAYDLAGLTVTLLGTPPEQDVEPDPEPAGSVQFAITFQQPLSNPWRAPAGFSHPTIDLYLDADPAEEPTGAGKLLPGRVAAAEPGTAWDYAFTIDGWGSAHFDADPAGEVTRRDTNLQYSLLADRRTLLVTVPRDELPAGDESTWRYGVAVLANRAIPALGLHDLRPLGEIPGRFVLGGGTGAVNEPLLLDVLQPARGVQEEALTVTEPVRRGTPDEVPRDRLAYLPMLSG